MSEVRKCPVCEGSGKRHLLPPEGKLIVTDYWVPCPSCGGKGLIPMKNKKLNEKLLKYAGFEYQSDLPLCYWVKDGVTYREAPNFTESLDACKEHLMPKLKCFVIEGDYRGGEPYLFIAKVWCYHKEYEFIERASAEDPALAFCLAVEKLIIDEEDKDAGK